MEHDSEFPTTVDPLPEDLVGEDQHRSGDDQVGPRSEELASGENRGTSISVASTLLVFMTALIMVRWIMPSLVEEVHYGIERGKQRAKYEFASKRLAEDPLAGFSESSQLVSDRIRPSVVHIDTRRSAAFATKQDAEPRVFERSTTDQEIHGQGSGVLLSDTGEILTNYHVIQNSDEILVTLADDRQSTATVIGVDEDADLAVLQLDEAMPKITPAKWGDSDELEEGAMVWAVGSPFGLSRSVTFGILSAKARRSYDGGRVQEYLQSDAAVSAGNSGGPLVDSRGNIIGINTAIVGPTYQGVSFSIPGNKAKGVYDRLVAQGPVRKGWLGVRLDKVPADINSTGAFITGLFDKSTSPAYQAGIEPGDIITRWGGKEIHSPGQLSKLVAESPVKEKVEVELVRNGKPQTLKVAVGLRPLQF